VQIAVEWCSDPVTRVTQRELWEWMLGRALQATGENLFGYRQCDLRNAKITFLCSS
jgi:hypothetical protein